MIDTETNLKAQVREFTGYQSELQLSSDGLDTAFDRAKSHAVTERSIGPDFEWFNTEFPQRQEVLFWFTCLFTKVETGELDSQDLQIGAIDQGELRSNDDGNQIFWYDKATSALESLQPEKVYQIRSNTRSSRDYQSGSFETGSGAGSGGSSTVDANDI